MKTVKLTDLVTEAEAETHVVRQESSEIVWTDRLAAGEKSGLGKPGVTDALWTAELPVSASEGAKPMVSRE